tara:strand:+ start:537 stop:674 length:138 start_codon:yes stop_codon:yes gene_type:complete
MFDSKCYIHIKPTHPLISSGTVSEVAKDIKNAIFSEERYHRSSKE